MKNRLGLVSPSKNLLSQLLAIWNIFFGKIWMAEAQESPKTATLYQSERLRDQINSSS
jgi:hypothetical protein